MKPEFGAAACVICQNLVSYVQNGNIYDWKDSERRKAEKMTILHMKCFISLVATKKMTDTAHLYGLQISTLSKIISSMEDEYTRPLFRRTSGGIVMTPEGKIIYPSILFIVKRYEDMLVDMNKFTSKKPISFRVSIVFHQPLLMMWLNEFAEMWPNANLSVAEETATRVEDRLEESSVDAAIIYEELLEKKYQHKYKLLEDELVAIVSNDHALAQRASISVAELKAETFFLFKGDNTMHRYQINACISAGFVPHESKDNLRVNTIIDAVGHGLGVSLLARRTVEHLTNGTVTILPLTEKPRLTMSLYFPDAFFPDIGKELVDFIQAK